MNKALAFTFTLAGLSALAVGASAQSGTDKAVSLGLSAQTPIAGDHSSSVRPPADTNLPQLDASAAGNAVASPAPVKGVNPGAAKTKRTLQPEGVWSWTTLDRNLMPVRNVLRLSTDKHGSTGGTLSDETGDHKIGNVTLGNGTLSFDVLYHVRGYGDLPRTFTVDLDADNPAVSVERPDFSPIGKANGGKRHDQHAARHETSG